ncbi:hypothetical protein F3Y22_tig00111542pilonHSYRG00173 [Hibiscus syriacus]|uniref:Uncharacterized protein n=1 Tax=Hibiscus syriacus TaxID=106335 RepID=A0A6A2Y6Y8_HIBSY|nr:uncharacterized protein LOC120164705 [Hibiscus syriacus]XP_039030303.1 uncharacterized protein LOC120164705 [Hibiscus syriacus]KAE8677225.1 hypothetical protein F3Y22_tig00111542pilonHSYRG00173 [Hibiscus syriacus]
MGISKTEVNFRRLLAAAPQQKNHSKLVHYIATLRELLEQLAEERTPEGLPRLSTAVVNDYSKKIEDIASELTATPPNIKLSEERVASNSFKQSPNSDSESHMPSSPGLRRRVVTTSSVKERTHVTAEVDTSTPIKLDAAAEAHIQKHRKLQEDLTDEMVELAQQLKERSLMMSQSLENTEKILDSTETAIEQSLATTGHTNVRAMKIYSETSKTSCFQWLLILAMICVFIMVVLLIRVT